MQSIDDSQDEQDHVDPGNPNGLPPLQGSFGASQVASWSIPPELKAKFGEAYLEARPDMEPFLISLGMLGDGDRLTIRKEWKRQEPPPRFALLRTAKRRWKAITDGVEEVLDDRRGMIALASLLERPGENVPTIDLADLDRQERNDVVEDESEVEVRRAKGIHVEAVDDPGAFRAVQRAIDDLEALPERSEAQDSDLEGLRVERAGMLKGRKFRNASRKAAKATSAALTRTLRGLADEAPRFAKEIGDQVEVGEGQCRYSPPTGRTWTVQREVAVTPA